MKAIFFETQLWERDRFQVTFPEALVIDAKLNSQNAKTETFKGAKIISTFINSSVTKEVIDAFPDLKLITTRSTGFDHIDVDYCRSRGILVANVPEYGSNTVAEHTFALILSLTRKIYESVNQSKGLNFNHAQLRGVDLYKKTIGIIGLGKIGKNVLRIAKGIGMNVLVHNRSEDPELARQYDFKYVSIEELLKSSDVVSLHLPLLPQTKHIINKDNIMRLKQGSYLINTARGGLIETEAIVIGLDQGILAGVGLDVLEEEKELGEEAALLISPYRKEVDLKTLVYNHILINHPRVLITPHNAFNSTEALERITQTTVDNIKRFLNDTPQNIVSDN